MKTFALLASCLMLLACGAAQPQQSPPPAQGPAPTERIITQENCTSDTWLLTHYAVERLASGSAPGPNTGYPLECCADDVLSEGERWRCDLDWPSSDVIDCRGWKAYRDALAAAHSEGTRSPLITKNLLTLARWFNEKHHCQ